MKLYLQAGALSSVLFAGLAFAGPVTDFETEFRQLYGEYRAALFVTNAGDQIEAAKATEALEESITTFAATWTAAPPHLADDPQWAETLSNVDALVGLAAVEVEAGALKEAHETLEGVRDQFGAMRLRNGLVTFSDRMNAYHTEMEHVLLSDLDQSNADALREQAAIMAYLARDIVANPPADAALNYQFGTLIVDFSTSVDIFLLATRSGDMGAIKAAAAGLKKPYSKLFLKFG